MNSVVVGLSENELKMIEFVGKQPRVKKRRRLTQVVNDSDDDDSSTKRKEPIERLINESPDKVIKMNSPEYR